jgi:heme exporter protein B
MAELATKLWWLVRKDLLSEYRARQFWPAMLLLGAVMVFIFTVQISLPANERQQTASGYFWLAVFFAGAVALDRTFGCERDQGCLDGLLSYPIPASLLFVAKVAVNMAALMSLACLLVPLFVVFAGVPLLAHPAALMLVLSFGTLGLAAIGTLLSALTSVTRQRASLLVLLVLPLAFPVLLAASEAMRLAMAGDFGAAWLRWIQLLAAFAVIYSTAGVVLFEFVVEE